MKQVHEARLRQSISLVLVVVRAESAHFVVRLGMVIQPAVTIDEDDIAAQSFGSVVRNVDVMSSVAVDLSITIIRTKRRCSVGQISSRLRM
jgi:hypothetical protein